MTPIEWDIPRDLINDAYMPYLKNMARVQIFYGGSGSGKSIFLAQRDLIDIMNGGRNFLICRAVARTLRKSVFAEIIKIINSWGWGDYFSVNKSELTITCANGYQFLFVGLDDTEKLKSITPERGVITDVRIEEATETNIKSLKQLIKRQRGGDPSTPKRITLSFNPIIKTHWIFQEYFKPIGWSDDQTSHDDGELSILKTWYIHNRFLTADDVYDLENEKDQYTFDVYTLGNWGVLGDLIFRNWRVEDLTDRAVTFDNLRHGLDFGFGVDPAAFNTTYYDRRNKTLYIIDEFSGLELTNDVLADMIKSRQSGMVYCDSAEPKSIVELQGYGVAAVGAKKGKGSIEHGIKWLKQQTIIIDSSCVGTQNEFSLYAWKKNRHGESLPVPEDRHNHHIDEIRYQYEDMANDMDSGVLWTI